MAALFGEDTQGSRPLLPPNKAACREIFHRHAPFVRVHQLYEEIRGRRTVEGTFAEGGHAGKMIGAATSRSDRVCQVCDGRDAHV